MRRLAVLAAGALVAASCTSGSGLAPDGDIDPAATATYPPPPSSVVSTDPALSAPATSTSTASTAADASFPALAAAGVDEMGVIPVLEYHLIEEPEARWTRTPGNFRSDVARLIEAGYYPINLADLADGFIDVPLGKSPVVLTFDDSSIGQCRYRAGGTPDPDSACGILLDAALDHPEDWRPRATFFVLLDVDVPSRILFGQPEWVEHKLADLVAWGMEIGSHTISHYALDSDDPDMVARQLAVPEQTIEALVPGYEVRSLSPPFGIYPADESVLSSGRWGSIEYGYDAAVHVAGGPSPSPFDPEFDPMHITRIQAVQAEIDWVLGPLAAAGGGRYVSDGDPATVAIPEHHPRSPRGDLPAGMAVVVYPVP